MTDDDTNVIAFEPRARQAPAGHFSELRLHDENRDLEMTWEDDAGKVVAVIAFDLVHCTPAGFDLDLLRAAWDERRGGSAVAS